MVKKGVKINQQKPKILQKWKWHSLVNGSFTHSQANCGSQSNWLIVRLTKIVD